VIFRFCAPRAHSKAYAYPPVGTVTRPGAARPRPRTRSATRTAGCIDTDNRCVAADVCSVSNHAHAMRHAPRISRRQTCVFVATTADQASWHGPPGHVTPATGLYYASRLPCLKIPREHMSRVPGLPRIPAVTCLRTPHRSRYPCLDHSHAHHRCRVDYRWCTWPWFGPIRSAMESSEDA
jgi:hypothetical protein